MKKLLSLFILICILTTAGCGKQHETKQVNPFGTDVYSKYSGPDIDFGFEYIQFQDDGTFIGVHYYWSYNYSTGKRKDTYPLTYGTYNIDGNSLTLNVVDKTYSCVIRGDHIMIGETDFYPHDINTFSDDFRNAISNK